MEAKKTYQFKGNTYTKKQYFNIMFGKEFIQSKDKGTLKEYKKL
tara:strand:- start:826 stop:957 length:132 start_codon:yes stop_codon:yes gene_type:complete